jgi:energy-coupling factor transporter ATP-binding protein EcfA2
MFNNIKLMTILNDIIDWVETKPLFWQVAIDKLIRNNDLTPFDLADLKEICKFEIGLSKVTFVPVDFAALRAFAAHASSSANIVLLKIHNINNINALSKTSVLEFAPAGITAVYGDNGAGKSSFVTVLKHTCNTRGQKPIINDNLYDPASQGTDKKAEVEFTTDGTIFNSVALVNSFISDTRLKGVDVFDSFSANHYIDGEDEIAFIPQGLSFIEKFATVLKQIETELVLEVQALNLLKFDFALLQLDDESTAKLFLQNLKHNTTIDQLRVQSQWNKTKSDRVTQLNTIITELKATDPQKTIVANNGKISRFKILHDKFELLENHLTTPTALALVKKTCNDFSVTFDTLKASSETVFANLPLTGIGGNSWKQLWESARKFYNENKEGELFPDTDETSNCPLCLQGLSPEAKKRFTDFEQFVKHDIQQEHDKAVKEHLNLTETVNGLSFIFDDQEPTIAELEILSPEYREGQVSYLKSLLAQKVQLSKHLAAKKSIEELTIPTITINSKNSIKYIITQLELENTKLSTQSITDVLKPLENELLELNSQKKMFDFKPKLAREIYRQKKVALLNQAVGQCNTRTVTTQSNLLTSTYITQNLKDNFQQELNKLGFKNIKIETETKGIKGKQYHYLKLSAPNASKIALKDILSEGEHRCIALATFLSELSLSEHHSAIVFDDPVSSLDHKWRNKIAKRIVQESNIRQVVVFTHDITFLLMLQEHAENLSYSLEIKSLTRKKDETGLIASNPPWDALPIGKRIGILKNEYQKIEKIERTETEEIYRARVKPLYGMLRETWERFVEEVFLNGTIQRFGREIQTQRLAKIVDLTIEDFDKVDENMGKCSTYFLGHDSAGTLIEEMPDAAEFLADITILEEFTKEIRNRRK